MKRDQLKTCSRYCSLFNFPLTQNGKTPLLLAMALYGCVGHCERLCELVLLVGKADSLTAVDEVCVN